MNLEIDDKEFLVLVGPSGCGKTTALRMIAGLEEVTDGEIYIGDRLVNDVSPKDRDIAMVFQNYALYPHMSVYDNMAFGLQAQKAAQEGHQTRVNEAAQAAGAGGPSAEEAQAAFRRPEAEGGARQGHRPRAGRVPDGRAAFKPRRQAARADPRGADQAAPTARDHHDLRHPRPGRGHDHGRPHRGHERRAWCSRWIRR